MKKRSRVSPGVNEAPDAEINLGEQPIAGIMKRRGMKTHDLVASSTEQITHKMVSRAMRGRRLTPNVKRKILNALSAAAKKSYFLKDLFNY